MENSNSAHVIAARRVLSEILADYRCSNYRVRLWDGSHWSSTSSRDKPSFTLVLNHPDSLRNMLESPSMLKLGEAFLCGSFDVEGDLLAACELGDHLLRLKLSLAKKIKLSSQVRSFPKGSTAAEG